MSNSKCVIKIYDSKMTFDMMKKFIENWIFEALKRVIV